MRKEQWLQQEISLWLADGLLSEAQSQQILARYSNKGGNLARTIFSVLGAIVFGLGVILFFAWNWSSMSHISKLGVIFTALLTAHTAGAYYRERGHAALGEGLSALGTLLFGSGIFLVSQIYHIDEHYPNAFLVWGSGALLLAWALPSTAQAMMACVLYVIWVSCELFDFRFAFDITAPLLAVTLIPLAWRQRSPWLFRLALLTSGYALLAALMHQPDHHIFVDCMLLAYTLVATGPMIRRSTFPAVANIPREFGYAGYLFLLIILAFRDGHELLRWAHDQTATQAVYFYVFAALALVGTVGAMRSIAGTRTIARINFAIMLLTTVLVLLTTEGLWVSDHHVWVWANVAALAHAVLWIIDGSQAQQGRKVTIACLLFSVIVVSRFIDLFDSMLMRSLLFLLLGAGLFFVGNFYQKQKATPQASTPEVLS